MHQLDHALGEACEVGVERRDVVGAEAQHRVAPLAHLGDRHATAQLGVGVALGVAPLWGALAVAVLGAVGLEWLRARGRLAGDLSLALVFYLGLALGLVVLSLRGGLNASVQGFLFGSIFAVTWADVAAIVALCALVVVVVAVAYRGLLAV